jgi:cobalamin synthase
VDSFLAALQHFTCIKLGGTKLGSSEPRVLFWSPFLGLATVGFSLLFYLPLAALYLPSEVAVIAAIFAIVWLRGFTAESAFGQLCDVAFGVRSRFSTRPVLGVPGSCCLVIVFLTKYAVLKQFFVSETVRLLIFSGLAASVGPLLMPGKDRRITQSLGLAWLVASTIIVLGPPSLSSVQGFAWSLRGPTVLCGSVFLVTRAAFALVSDLRHPSTASVPAEMAAYLAFLTVRYLFL